MKIRVLGSSGSRVPGYQTSCLLIDEKLAIDAGGLTAQLSVDEQAAIDHVLISHAHLDHVYDLAFLADNVMARRTRPLRVWGPREVLATLQQNVFNDQLWPDLTGLDLGGFPVLEMCPLPPGALTRIGPVQVRWARTNHPVFAAGYLVEAGGRAILYSGDTSTTEALWTLGDQAGALQAVFVETSFPNRLEALALETGHLTPQLLARELGKLDKPDVPVKIFHMKPQFLEEIRNDLLSCQIPCEILRGGEEFEF